MKKLALLFACASISIACGSPAVNNGASSSKSNVNAVNSVPYSQSENAYSLAQRDIDLLPLEHSVGKTAGEMELWQNKEVVRRLRKLMGSDFATMREFWNVETPVKKFGDILMLTGCERNNCEDNRYVIFISLSEGIIKVVHIGKDATKEWIAKGEYREIGLPPPFEEELTNMKAHRYR